jgi:hypothetical protein
MIKCVRMDECVVFFPMSMTYSWNTIQFIHCMNVYK